MTVVNNIVYLKLAERVVPKSPLFEHICYSFFELVEKRYSASAPQIYPVYMWITV